MTKETLNSKELINALQELCASKKFKKQNPLPKFTMQEARFIADLIFNRPKDLVYLYLVDHIVNRTEKGRMRLFDSRGYRKYLFLVNFLTDKGNAAKAAILSGYSPRSAKQQGHRLLRQIQQLVRNN